MQGDFFNEAVTVIHSFRGCMEHIFFNILYLLRAATFLEDLSYAFDFFKDSPFI